MEIDVRGLSCPQPVIETKKVLDTKVSSLSVMVDNVAAKENVSRYAKSAGYTVEVTEQEDAWLLLINKA